MVHLIEGNLWQVIGVRQVTLPSSIPSFPPEPLAQQ
jgi:hypothetical protein